MIDDVIPRYLVIVDGEQQYSPDDYESEAKALRAAEEWLAKFGKYRRFDNLEVVKSVRRWELDTATGEMLEVGEKLREQSV